MQQSPFPNKSRNGSRMDEVSGWVSLVGLVPWVPFSDWTVIFPSSGDMKRDTATKTYANISRRSPQEQLEEENQREFANQGSPGKWQKNKAGRHSDMTKPIYLHELNKSVLNPPLHSEMVKAQLWKLFWQQHVLNWFWNNYLILLTNLQKKNCKTCRIARSRLSVGCRLCPQWCLYSSHLVSWLWNTNGVTKHQTSWNCCQHAGIFSNHRLVC